MRVPLALSAVLLAAVPPLAALRWTGPMAGDPVVGVSVPFDPGDPERRAFGRLVLQQAWILTSRDRRFGGVSSLVVDGPGRLIGWTDAGMVVRLAVTARGMIGSVGPQPGVVGMKRGRDAESLTRDPASGRSWVGFEYRNAIARISPDSVRVEAEARPAAMAGWPENGGAEAMTRLPDGRFLVIAESAGAEGGGRRALLFPGDPADPATGAPIAFAYRPPKGYSPSDAAALPDGRVLVLNRRFALPFGFPAEIGLIDPRRVRAGQSLAGEPVVRFAPPLRIDNLEGMAVERTPQGLVMWLISDDNFLALQRTVLLRFALRLP